MTLTNSNRWAASGAVAGAAIIIYNPILYQFFDVYFTKSRDPERGWWGYILRTIILFFVVYGLLCISWACV